MSVVPTCYQCGKPKFRNHVCKCKDMIEHTPVTEEAFTAMKDQITGLEAQVKDAKQEANDIENKRQALHAKLKHEIKCHDQTQAKCDDLRADKLDYQDRVAGYKQGLDRIVTLLSDRKHINVDNARFVAKTYLAEGTCFVTGWEKEHGLIKET